MYTLSVHNQQEIGDGHEAAAADLLTARRFLFVEELASRWGVSVRTIRERLQMKAFPVVPLRGIDRKLRFSLADVEAYERREPR